MKKLICLIFFLICLPLFATEYYVDPKTGDNDNNGTSDTTPWATLPGTYKADNSSQIIDWDGDGTDTWPTINAGDTIWIKSGSSFSRYGDVNRDGTYDNAGQVIINSTYYGNGTSGSPITISRKTDWGKGQITFSGHEVEQTAWRSLIHVEGRDFITITGITEDGIGISDAGKSNLGATGDINSCEGIVFEYIEAANAGTANVFIDGQSKGTPANFLKNPTLNYIHSHDNKGSGGDSGSGILIEYTQGAVVSNCTSYNAGIGTTNEADGIHLGNCYNAWVINCTTYNNREQGIDISKGSKSQDSSYDVTVRGCISYNNRKMNIDVNSGSKEIYMIYNEMWKTTLNAPGDANAMVYEGARGGTYWINCTTANGQDWGYGAQWWDCPDTTCPDGTYEMAIVNSISHNEGKYGGDTGESVNIASDWSGKIWAGRFFNSNFGSTNSSGIAVQYKSKGFTASEINSGNDWDGDDTIDGYSCISSDPLFTDNTGTTYADVELSLQSTSPCVDTAVFPFTAQSDGDSTTVDLYSVDLDSDTVLDDLDARRIFRAGDSIEVGGTSATISSVTDANTIVLSSSVSWSAGDGVWFPWSGTALDMGAREYVYPSVPKTPVIDVINISGGNVFVYCSGYGNSDPNATHQATQIQIFATGEATPKVDVTLGAVTTWNYSMDSLDLGKKYKVKVRYKDSNGKWSAWSFIKVFEK